MLHLCYNTDALYEAGCDEAGRGCLAGPVYAAAVILPVGYRNERLMDSKQISRKVREELRPVIERDALAWSVAAVPADVIDEINILNASILAMHRALEGLATLPDHIIVDGNRFKPFGGIPHCCIVDGDALYQSIAAASILAKTHRDEYMYRLHNEFPAYHWQSNVGYATRAHREAILQHGRCIHHRKTFQLSGQLDLFTDP